VNPVDGSVWFTRMGALFRTPPAGGAPARIRTPFDDAPDSGAYPVFHDGRGWLWMGTDARVCRTAAATPGDWTCEVLPGRAVKT
jgi:hypothetical protein